MLVVKRRRFPIISMEAKKVKSMLRETSAAASALEMDTFNLENANFHESNQMSTIFDAENQYLYLHPHSIAAAAPPNLLPPTCSIPFSNSHLSYSSFFGHFDPPKSHTDYLGSIGCDSLLPLNQPPLFRDPFQSGGAPKVESMFGLLDERIGAGGIYPNQCFDNKFFEFTAGETDHPGDNKHGMVTKYSSNEKQRRVSMNDKFKDLIKLIPNPTKNDQATILADAIEYINELQRTVAELNCLAEKKRNAKEKRLKSTKIEPEDGVALRTSWLHKKSKNIEIDVRIIGDEVTVKLVQQKKINCLVHVSKVLDEVHLDLHHVAGGVIGDYYSFLFNSKICQGSVVCATKLANKLIEAVDQQYAAASSS